MGFQGLMICPVLLFYIILLIFSLQFDSIVLVRVFVYGGVKTGTNGQEDKQTKIKQ